MKSVIIAEKPSVARDFARVLGCNQSSKSSFEGKDYIITWALGHLVEPADPDEYHESWKKWDLSYLPMIPDLFKLRVIKRTSFQFNAIKSILKRSDIDCCIIATDAGREGELVARWILKLSGYHGKLKRLWISSQTDKAIKDGFAQLKDASAYTNLFHAAECRSEADWIIGLNVTRALSCKYDAKLSAGRVQTPTLALIANREDEIKNFKPVEFRTIEAFTKNFKAIYCEPGGNTRIFNKDKADEIINRCQGKDLVIKSVESKTIREQPPQAYDLTTLQSDANRLLGFSPKYTLTILQGLYERHKIVTYPRTNSKYISNDIVPTLKERLKAIDGTIFGQTAKKISTDGPQITKRFVDDTKVTDHHAIIPTEEKVFTVRLSREELSLWTLIVKRFLAILSNDATYTQHLITSTIGSDTFITKGKEEISAGWKSLFSKTDIEEETEEHNQNIKKFSHKQGDILSVQSLNSVVGRTNPPHRYTEGTLIMAMENASKFVKDKELKESLSVGGLGTPATRADIIEKLFTNYYIEKKVKDIYLTPQGIGLLKIVPEKLKNPELTAEWEIRFDSIAEGKEKPVDFIKDIVKSAHELIDSIKSDTKSYTPHNQSSTSCPMCGSIMLEVKGKKQEKLLVCRSRICGYEQRDEFDTGLRRNKTQKEKMINSKMIHKYTDTNAKDTFTLADLMKSKEK